MTSLEVTNILPYEPLLTSDGLDLNALIIINYNNLII